MLKNRTIPFGYCVINGKCALNTTESETVKKIFSDYINGKSLKTIAAEMEIPYNANKIACKDNTSEPYTATAGIITHFIASIYNIPKWDIIIIPDWYNSVKG